MKMGKSGDSMSKKVVHFEKDLDELEKLVESLEKGELGLGESLDKFEKGVMLYKSCKNELEKAEKKIALLTDQLNEQELD